MKPDSIILQSIVRLLIFFINTLALYLMLQGHNNPGGGFIAGLVSAISIVLLNFSFDIDEVKKVIRIDPVLLAGIGLVLAYGSASIPMAFDLPYLKHSFIHLHIPMLGEIHLGTPLIFDFGVYLVVVGVTCKILMTLSYLVNEREEYFLEETFLYSSSLEKPAQDFTENKESS